MKTRMTFVGLTTTILMTACEMEVVHNHHVNLDELTGGMKVVTAELAEGASRTVLTDKTGGGKTLLWSKGDKILVTDGTKQAVFTTETDGKAVAEFANNSSGLSLTAAQYTAYYPETLSPTALALPAVQTYVPDGMSGFPMMAVSETGQFSFRNLCGVLCLRIKTNGGYGIEMGEIRLSSPDCGLSGTFKVEDYKAVITEDNGGLTLDCGDGAALAEDNFTDFYLYLPDGSYETLYLTIADTEGAEIKLESCGTITIKQSRITQVTLVLDTANYNGSLEDLPVIDNGTGFTVLPEDTDIPAGMLAVTDDDVDMSTR